MWFRQEFTRLPSSLGILESAIYNAKKTGWKGKQVILTSTKQKKGTQMPTGEAGTGAGKVMALVSIATRAGLPIGIF